MSNSLFNKICNVSQKWLYLANCLIKELRKDTIVINSYAWRNYDGSVDHSNWGDDINWYFLREIIDGNIITYYHAPLAQRFNLPNYVVIGSTIDQCADEKSIIWGAGIINSSTSKLPEFKKICAVRGPKTRSKLLSMGINCPEVYGDPALLIPYHYNPRVSKKFKLGIIPHFHDLEKIKNDFISDSSITVIDIRNYEKWTDFIDQILECDGIASSSLHGLIMAYAYNIPNVWIEFGKGENRDRFKYDDFFSSIGKEENPILINDIKDINKIENALIAWTRGNIDLEPLIKAAPFKIKF